MLGLSAPGQGARGDRSGGMGMYDPWTERGRRTGRHGHGHGRYRRGICLRSLRYEDDDSDCLWCVMRVLRERGGGIRLGSCCGFRRARASGCCMAGTHDIALGVFPLPVRPVLMSSDGRLLHSRGSVMQA